MSKEELEIVWKLRRCSRASTASRRSSCCSSGCRKSQTNIEFLMQVQKTTPAPAPRTDRRRPGRRLDALAWRSHAHADVSELPGRPGISSSARESPRLAAGVARGGKSARSVPVHVPLTGAATTRRPERTTMKKDIHPEYRVTEVTCTCGDTFTTRSTATNGIIHADVCSNATRSTPASRRSSTPAAASPASRPATPRRPPQTPTRAAGRLQVAPDGAGHRIRGAGVVRLVRRRTPADEEPPCSRPSRAWSPSTPSSSGSWPSRRRTPTRGWRRGSTSGTPS